MALSDADRETVFEILEIPSYDQMGLMVDQDNLATFAINYGDSAKRTSLYVDAMIALINTSAAKLAMLQGYVDRWNEIETDPSKQQAGNIGNLTGITDDPTAELKIIKGRVERLLAIRRWNEAISSTRDKASPSVMFGNVIAG